MLTSYPNWKISNISKQNSQWNPNDIVATNIDKCNNWLPTTTNSHTCYQVYKDWKERRYLYMYKHMFLIWHWIGTPGLCMINVCKYLPESTVWTLLSKTEKERRTERLETISTTSSSVENKDARFRLKNKQRIQKHTPIPIEVLRITFIENFAALAFPLPSSFDTRTLPRNKRKKLFLMKKKSSS